MSTQGPDPVETQARFYQLQVQITNLGQQIERQQRTIDALIASLPQLSQQTPGAPSGGRSSSGGKVYREWVSWLGENGPAYRREVMDGVGKPLPGNQPVLDWTSVMATWPDDAVPSDTLCKINGVSTGQGRPPTVYFLWKHRFMVHVCHGVGPSERPAVEATKTETLLGVIHPPATVESHSNAIEPNPEPTVETSGYERYATLEEWHERWDPVFDELAPYNAVPTDEEKAAMRATLPEDTGGEPWSVILTLSYQEAKVRSGS